MWKPQVLLEHDSYLTWLLEGSGVVWYNLTYSCKPNLIQKTCFSHGIGLSNRDLDGNVTSWGRWHCQYGVHFRLLCQKWFSSFSDQLVSPCSAYSLFAVLWPHPLVEVEASLETLSQTVCVGSCFLLHLALVLGWLTGDVITLMEIRALALRGFGRRHQNTSWLFELVPALLRIYSEETGCTKDLFLGMIIAELWLWKFTETVQQRGIC